MDENTDTPQPIKRKRGRPPKMRPGYPKPIATELTVQALDKLIKSHGHEPRDTPTIKEGASWQVGVPEEEQDELKKRHNEALERKMQDEVVSKVMEPIFTTIEPNSVIQIRTEGRMGQLALVGEVEGDTLHCYQFIQGGAIDHISVKTSECVLVSNGVKGMRVLKYERQQIEEAPDWHQDNV